VTSDKSAAALPAITSSSAPVPAPPPHPLDAEWFMHADGTNYGPFTGHQFREFVRDGRLHRDTDVNRAGTDVWCKAGEDKALALLFPSAVPAQRVAHYGEGSQVDPASGHVSAAKGATIVQVTNNLAPPEAPKPTVIVGTDAKPKSAGTALVLSILLCGLGQIYNGQVGKGLLMMLLCVLLWVAMLGWIINIWSIIDAYSTAKSMNERYLRLVAAGAIV
jgi:TM2 domain-containing membrane protein YozV